MLEKIPLEILDQIRQHISRHDVHQASLASKYLYNALTPSIYRHLDLGYFSHIQQLQHGIANNCFLRNVILQHTKHLTLRSKQNGNRWRVQDLLRIVGDRTKIELLTFRDCSAITTSTIHEIISILPCVKHVEFKYCHIIYASMVQSSTSRSITYLGTLKDNLGYGNSPANNEYTTKHGSRLGDVNKPLLQRVSYVWTDFTERAIVPSLFSQITHLDLGSNRNKYESVNEIMMHAIPRYCPAITHLTIALPAILEETICYTISAYGQQLQHLSIRCDGSQTLSTIATYATRLQSLFIRITKAAEKENMNVPLLGVIEKCLDIKELKVTSRQLDKDIPNILWDAIITCSTKNISRKDKNRILRAQDVLTRKLQLKSEGNDLNVRQQQPSISRTVNSIWSYPVGEEALEPRPMCNNFIHGSCRQQNNTMETFYIDEMELLRSKTQLLEIKSIQNDVPIAV